MGKKTRTKTSQSAEGFGKRHSSHPKVTKWVQENLYPMFFADKTLCVYFDESLALRVLRIPCAVPTKDSEIQNDDCVRFRYNLESYLNHQRIVCFLKIEEAFHLYLLDVDADGLEFQNKSRIRHAAETEFDWSLFTQLIGFTEGYYLLDYLTMKTYSIGLTWDNACETLHTRGQTLSRTRSSRNI